MAPMASMLARCGSSASAACRASRAAGLASARAARSAAAARRAAAAVSRAASTNTDAAAAADLALGTTSSREARSLRCDASRGGAPSRLPPGSDSMHSDGCLFPDDKNPEQTPVVDDEADEFVADEKDLESDEALWALYERWCKHFNEERDRDEMARRFGEFKRVVLFVHQENNSGGPNKLGINQFTDGKRAELCLGGFNALKQVEFAAKFPKTGVSYLWLNGKYYMEVTEELPKAGRFVWLQGKCYMKLPEECQPE